MASVSLGENGNKAYSEKIEKIIKEVSFRVIENSSINSGDILREQEEISYNTNVVCLKDGINNIIIERIIPEGIEYKEGYVLFNGNRYELGYDADNRKAFITMEQANKDDSIAIVINVVVGYLNYDEYEKNIESHVCIKGENTDIYEGEYIENKIAKPKVVAYQNFENKNKYVKENDEIKYTVEIRNEGSVTAKNVEIKSIISNVTDVIEANYSKGDIVEDLFSTNNENIIFYTDINSGETVFINIRLRTKQVQKYTEITLWQVIEAEDIQQIITDEVVYIIEGKNLVQEPTNNVENKNNYEEESQNEVYVKKYTITGQAWLDKDKNGEKGKDENGIKEIKTILVNSEFKSIAETKTNENGIYEFNGIDAR